MLDGLKGLSSLLFSCRLLGLPGMSSIRNLSYFHGFLLMTLIRALTDSSPSYTADSVVVSSSFRHNRDNAISGRNSTQTDSTSQTRRSAAGSSTPTANCMLTFDDITATVDAGGNNAVRCSCPGSDCCHRALALSEARRQLLLEKMKDAQETIRVWRRQQS